jgi:hypothetical protein
MIRKLSASTIAASITALALAGTVYAHHAASAEYDVEKAIQFKGVLTKIQWINPHTHMWFDVKGPDGKVTNWMIEFAGISGLSKAGLKNRSELAIGNEYTLTLSPARDSRHAGIINTMTFPDGHVFKIAATE